MTATIPQIDITVDESGWLPEEQLSSLAQRSIAAAVNRLNIDLSASEVSLVFTGDDAIRALNAHWRGKDRPTNVLSFPAFEPRSDRHVPEVLGDIVIARQIVTQEANLENMPFDHHLTHLVIHGFLHLLGYDHENDEEAEAMENLESAILDDLGIPDPYRDPR